MSSYPGDEYWAMQQPNRSGQQPIPQTVAALLTWQKEECERQYARAEAAEQRLARVHEAIRGLVETCRRDEDGTWIVSALEKLAREDPAP